jgi:hypothetical protein
VIQRLGPFTALDYLCREFPDEFLLVGHFRWGLEQEAHPSRE